MAHALLSAPSVSGTPGPHSATLTWSLAAANPDNAQPISSYRIMRATGPAGPFSEVHRFYAPPGGFADGGATMYVDPTAAPTWGHTYAYVVRIADALGLTADSAQVPVKPGWAAWHMGRGDSYRSGRSAGAVPLTPFKLWQTSGTINNFPSSMIHHAGMLYGGGQMADISAIDAFTGANPTTFSVGSSIYYTCPVVGPDGFLYATLDVTNTTADLTSHVTPALTMRWDDVVNTAGGAGVCEMDPVIAGNGTVVWGDDNGDAFGSRDLGAIGATVWMSSDPSGQCDGDTVVLMNGNVVFVRRRPAPPHDVVCVTSSGAPVWTRTIGGTMASDMYAAQLAVGPQGWLYVATTTLQAFDQNGNYVWRYDAPGTICGVAVEGDGRVAITTEGAAFRIQGLSAAGTLIWSSTVNGGAINEITPPVITGDGRILLSYQNTSNPKSLGLIAFRESDGACLWQWKSATTQTFTGLICGPVVTPDGRIYAGYYDTIYGFSSPAAVSISQAAAPGLVHAGGEVLTYSISWSNASGMTGSNLCLWDTFPAGLEYAGVTFAYSVEPGATVTPSWATSMAGPWTTGEPPDGATSPLALRWCVSLIGGLHEGRLSYGCRVSAATPDGAVIANSACATLFDGSGTPFLQSAASSATVVNQFTAPGMPATSGQNAQVSLSWSPAWPGGGHSVSMYEVWRATCASCGYLQAGATPPAGPGNPTVTWHVDTGLVNGKPYWFKVRAVNEVLAAGPFSGTATGSPDGSLINPPADCAVQAVPGTGNRVMVSWPIVGGGHPATSYAVFRSTFAGVPATEMNCGGTCSMSATSCLCSIEAAGTYWFYVRALGSLSDPSPLSAPVTISGNPPSRPGWLSAAGGPNLVALQWSPAIPGDFALSGYRIYRATYSGNWDQPLYRPPVLKTVFGLWATGWIDATAVNGTVYWYTVDAFDDRSPPNESGNSNQALGAPCTRAGAAANLRTVGTDGVGPIQVVLGWTKATPGTYPITSYVIWRGPAPGLDVPIATVVSPGNTVTVWTDTGVAAGTGYCYRVQAVDVYGSASTVFSYYAFTAAFQNPGPPSGLVPAAYNGEVDLSWTAGTKTTYDVAGHFVYRSTYSGGELYSPLGSGVVPGWVTSASMTQNRDANGLATNGTFVWAIGGEAATKSAVLTASVDVAQVKADGTLTPFASARPLPAAMRFLGAVWYRGNIYVAGGDNGTAPSASVLMAHVNPDASLGPWQVMPSLPAARNRLQLVAIDDRLYAVGGADLGSPTPTVYADVFTARIYPDGTIGNWTATGALPQGRYWHGCAVVEGRLYVTGGYASGQVVTPTVYIGIPDAAGNLTWGAGNPMPTGRQSHWSVSSKGKLYVGDGSNDTAYDAMVYWAPILGDGSVGAWTATAKTANYIYWAPAVATGDRIYVVGGYDAVLGSSRSDSEVGLIEQNQVPIPTTTYPDTPLVNGTTYYYVARTLDGGGNLSTPSPEVSAVPSSGVPAAPVLVHAVPSAGFAPVQVRIGWTPVVAAPPVTCYRIWRGLASGGEALLTTVVTPGNTTSLFIDTTVIDGTRYVYQVSAVNNLNKEGARSFEVYARPYLNPAPPPAVDAISSNNSAQVNWTLPAPKSFALSGYLVYRATYVRGELYCPLGAKGLAAWANASPLPSGSERMWAGAAVMDGWIHVGGGSHSSLAGDDLGDLASAPMLASGALGPWVISPSCPMKRYGSMVAAANGKVYLIGGIGLNGAANAVTTSIYVASILPDGSVGSWRATKPLPSILCLGNAVAFENRIYVIGGAVDTTGTQVNTVYVCDILPDGSLGTWTTTSPLPAARAQGGIAVVDRWIYYTGGDSGTKAQNTVYRASFAAGGGLTAWVADTPLAAVRDQHACFAGTGEIYALRGTDGKFLSTDGEMAAVRPDGSLGPWQAAAIPSITLQSPAAAYINGYGVIVGGSSGAGPVGNVETAVELRNLVSDPGAALTDATAVNGTVYRYRVRSVDVEGNLSTTTMETLARPANYGITVKARHPEQLYVNGGEQQLWRVSWSNATGANLYNVVLRSEAGAFSGLTYVSPSLTSTVNGASMTGFSWSADAAGPWTTGEPPNGQGEPLYLRWAVSQVAAGRSGELSYRTRVTSGAAALLRNTVSATMSSDAALSGYGMVLYASTGTGKRIEPPQVYIKNYNGYGSVADAAYGVAGDAAGNVVVTGAMNRPDLGHLADWFTAKLDPAGNIVWSRTYNSPDNSGDEARGVALDSAGNVIVAGYGVAGGDGIVVKYDPSGNVQWTKTYNSPPSGADGWYGVAVDGSNNILTVGEEGRSDMGQNTNFLVHKYDPAGNLLWSYTYNGAANGADFGNAVAANAGGFVAAVGYETRADVNQGQNGFLMVLAPDRTLLWSRSVVGPGGDDQLRAVAFDPNGNIVVSGYWSNTVAGQSNDWVIRKYDQLGNPVWTQTYDSPAHSDDRSFALAVDGDGNVYAGGFEGRPDLGESWTWLIRKYDNAGNFLGSVRRPPLVFGSMTMRGMGLVPGSGDILAAGDEPVQDEATNYTVARWQPGALPLMSAPTAPVGLAASCVPGAVKLDWTPATQEPWGRPVSGYVIFRATWPGVVFTAAGGTPVWGGGTSSSTVNGLTPGLPYYFRILAVDTLGVSSILSNEAAGAVCAELKLTMNAIRPEPLYVNGGDVQLWRVAFSNAGSDTLFNLTVTTGAGSFTARSYVPGSLSATVTGIGAVDAGAWATSLAGPWTPGQPGVPTSDPLYLRWAISSLYPGRSAEISFRTSTLGTGDLLLDLYASVTLSCDSGLFSNLTPGYSSTATGKRIQAPLAWLAVANGVGSVLTVPDDRAHGVVFDADGGVIAAGCRTCNVNTSLGLIRKYTPGGILVWSRTLAAPGTTAVKILAAAPMPGGGAALAGVAAGSAGNMDWILARVDSGGGIIWTRTYAGASSLSDQALGIATDGSGNIFAAGFETVTGEAGNWLVRRYDPAGTLVWSRTSGAPGGQDDEAQAVALDPAGNVIVAGWQDDDPGAGNDFDWTIRKYSSAGDLLWTRTFDGGIPNDRALAVATDGAGFILAAGYDNLAGNENWSVRRLDPEGGTVWQASYSGPVSGWDDANAIGVDRDGNVTVAGYETRTDLGQGRNWRVIRYNAAGMQLDSLAHDGLVSADDELLGLAVAPSGTAVYVSGYESVRGEGQDFAVARWDLVAYPAPVAPAGLTAAGYPGSVGLQWTPVSPAGNVSGYRVYRQTWAGVLPIAGALVAQVAGAASSTYVDAGAPAWQPSWFRVTAVDWWGVESEASMEATATALGACTPNLTLAARNPEPLYALTGESQLWRFAVNNSGLQTAYNVTISSVPASFADKMYSSGASLSATITGGGVLASRAYSFDGVAWTAGECAGGCGGPLRVRWVISQLGPGRSGELSFRASLLSGSEGPVTLAVSSTQSCDPGGLTGSVLGYSATATGGRIVSPLEVVRTYNSARNNDDVAYGVAADTSGNVYMVGYEWRSDIFQSSNWFVRKYDSTGALAWYRTWNGPSNGQDLAYAIALDPGGNPVVAGTSVTSIGGFDAMIRKYDSAGLLVWSRTYNTPVMNNTEYAYGVAVDSSGNIAIAGYVLLTGEGFNWLVQKYDPTGVLLWTRTYGGPSLQNDVANAVAFDPAGNVVVAGYESRSIGGQDWLIQKYDSAGNTIWQRWYNGTGNTNDAAYGVDTDANGNIYVAGYATLLTQDWIVRKYDAAGSLIWTRTYNSPGNNTDVAYAVRAGADGTVLVGGSELRNDLGQSDNWSLNRYDNAGNLLGHWTHNGLAGGIDVVRAVAWVPGAVEGVIAGEETVTGEGKDAVWARYAFGVFTPPSSPAGLVATGYPGVVGLEWNAAAMGTNAVSGYRIYRTTFAGVIPTLGAIIAEVAGSSASTYLDVGVAAGSTVWYRVAALDVGGVEGPLSNESSAVGMQAIATLEAGLATFRAAVSVGQSWLVTMTVTNTGTVTATAVAPAALLASGSGGAGAAGPWPTGYGAVTPGGMVVFTWTCTASAAGTLVWSATATASGGVLSNLAVAPAVTVQAAANLAGHLSVYGSPVCLTGTTLVTLTVSNTGVAPATGVWAPIPASSGTGAAVRVAGPSPTMPVMISGGGVVTFSYTYQGTAEGLVALTTTVSGLDGNGGWAVYAGPVVADLQVNSGPFPAVLVTQSPTIPSLGGAISYRIVVANVGSSTIAAMTLLDTVSPVVTGASATGPAAFGAAIVSQVPGGTLYAWTGAVPLVPGAAFTFTITGTVGEVCAPTAVSNTAYVVAGNACGVFWQRGVAQGAVVQSPPTTVSVVETRVPAVPSSGSPVTYYIAVRNTGTTTIMDLVLADTFAASLTGVAAEVPPGFVALPVAQTASGTWFAWAGAALNMKPGAAFTFTITGVVGNVCVQTTVSNTAWVGVKANCGVSEDSSTPSGYVFGSPAFTIAASQVQSTSTPGIGQQVSWGIVVENTGGADITRLLLVDTLSPSMIGVTLDAPAGFVLKAASAPGGSVYSWESAALLMTPGTVFSFTITGTVGPVCSVSTLPAVASAEAWTACPAAYAKTLSNPLSMTVQPHTTSIVVGQWQSPAAPATGDLVRYRILVANTGTATLGNLQVADTIPGILTGTYMDSPAGFTAIAPASVAGGTRYAWSGTGLFMVPGAAYTFTITGRAGVVCAPSAVSSTAWAFGSGPCGGMVGFGAPAGFTLDAPVLAVTVSQTQTPAAPAPGGPLGYTIVVTNSGDATVTGMVVTDTVSPVMTAVTQTVPGGFLPAVATSTSGGTLYSWVASAPFPPGASATFSLNGTVGSSCAALSVSNTVYVGGVADCGAVSQVSPATGFDLPAESIAVGVQITQSAASPGIGAPLAYLIEVTNAGPGVISSLTIVDTVSPLLVGTVTAQPASFAPPVVTSVAGGTRYEWSAGGLTFLPSERMTFTITGGVGFVCGDTEMGNTAYVAAGSGCGTATALAGVAGNVVTPSAFGLATQLLQEPAAPVPGDRVTYRIIVTNAGTATAVAIEVVDTVSAVVVGATADQPAEFSAAPVGQTASGSVYAWTGAGSLLLTPGAVFTFTITGTVGEVCGPTTAAGEAIVIGASPCSQLVWQPAGVSFDLDAAALSVAAADVQSASSPGMGAPLAYAIVVSNTGTATVTALSVVDTVSPVLTGLSPAQPSGFGAPTVTSVAGGTRYEWSATGLAMSPGATWTFTVSGTVGVVCAPTAMSNAAVVTARAACDTVGIVSVAAGNVVQPASAGVSIVQGAVPPSVPVGSPVSFQLVVTNLGTATLESVTVTDTVAPEITGVGTSTPAGFSAATVAQGVGGTIYTWTSTAPFFPGAVAVFQVDGAVGGVCGLAAVSNTGFISGSSACAQVGQVSGVAGFEVAGPVVGLTVDNLQSAPDVRSGEGFGYTIRVTNTGEATVVALTLVETLSPVLTDVTAVPPGPFPAAVVTSVAGAGTRYEWSATGLSLPPGGIWDFLLTGRAGVVCGQSPLSNTAYVSVRAVCGTADRFAVADGAVLAPAAVNLAVATTQTPAVPVPGDPVRYEIVVSNLGGATMASVVVTDTIAPAVAGVVPTTPAGFAAPAVSQGVSGTIWTWVSSAPFLPGTSATFRLDGVVGAVCSAATVSETAFVAAVHACGSEALASNPTGFLLDAAVPGIAVVQYQAAGAGMGSPISYRVVVTNTGTDTVTALSVIDTVPSVVVGAAAEGPVAMGLPAVSSVTGGTRFAWSGAGLSLSPGEAWTFTISGGLGAVCAGTLASNSVFVAADFACGTLRAAANPVAVSVAPAVTAVTIATTAVPAAPGIGDTFRYEIAVSNVGSATIDGILIVDTVSPVVSVTGTSTPGGFAPPVVTQSAAGTIYTWSSISPLYPGTVATFLVNGTVGQVCSSTVVPNTAWFAGDSGCAAVYQVSGPADFGLTVPPLAVAAAESVQVGPEPGAPLVWRLVVANTGGATVTDLVVVDTLPGQIVNAVADAPPVMVLQPVASVSGGTRYAWTGTGLSFLPGTAWTFTVTGNAGFVCAPAGISDTAYVEALTFCDLRELSPSSGAVIQPAVAALTVVKTQVPPSPVAGGPVSWTIQVTNSGAATLTGLVVVDTVSPVVTGVGATTPGGYALQSVVQAASGTIWSWSGPGPLGPGASVTFTLTGTVGSICSPVAVGNTGYVTARADCGPIAAGSGVAGFALSPSGAGISVVANQSAMSPGIGATQSYTIQVTNTGASPVTALTVVDTVPAILTGVSTSQPAVFSPPVVTSVPGAGTRYEWSATGLSMATAVPYTFTITGRIGLVCAARGVSNTAYVVAAAGCGTIPQLAGVPGHVVQAPVTALAMIRSRTPASPVPGGPVSYRMVLVNSGTATLSDLTVIDTLAAASFGSQTSDPALAHSAAGAVHTWYGALVLTPGATATVTIDGTLACAGGTVSNDARALGGAPCMVITAQPAPDSFALPQPATLAGAGAVTPAVVVGGAIRVALTITNTGGMDAPSVIPAIAAGPGAGLVSLVASPTGAAAVPAGSTTTFEWVYSTSAPGVVTFTVTGSGLGCGGAAIGASAVLSATVQSLPGVLSRSVAVSRTTISVGQPVLVALTVTNTGGSAITNVGATLWLSSGTASWSVTGPVPASAASLAAGAGQTFAFTVMGLSAGSMAFTATAAGDLGIASAAVSTPVITVQTAASLSAVVAASPATVCAGQPIVVSARVTNSGQAGANVTAIPIEPSGAAVVPAGGPTPALPYPLGGASSVTFSWTYTAGAAGDVDFTATVSGTDANSGAIVVAAPAASGSVTMALPAALTASLEAPATVATGVPFSVTLWADNTAGGSAAAGVSVTATSTGAVGGGPVSPASQSVAAGTKAGFVWMVTPSAGGAFVLTATATGMNCGGSVTAAASAGVAAVAPATLTATLIVTPAGPVVTGSLLVARLTITDTGGAGANGVSPVLTPVGAGGSLAGPVPAGPVSLGVGGAVTFVWTYTVTGAGSVGFGASAGGTDAASGLPVSTGALIAPAVVVQTPALLSVSIGAAPPSLCTGQPILVSALITNSGQTAATGVTAASFHVSGGGAIGAVTPPTPAMPATVPGNTSMVFTWTVAGSGAGTVVLTTTVTGTDALSGLAVSAGPGSTGAVTIGTGASLVSAVSFTPATASTGQPVIVTLTVTNTGGTDAWLVAAVPSITAGTGTIGPVAPPNQTVPLGGMRTFFWQYTPAAAGTHSFSVTATGTTCGSVGVSTLAAGSLNAVAPASLTGTVLVTPAGPVATGSLLVIAVTVDNPGGADANTVNPVLSPSGVAGVLAGPTPGPATIAAGANRTFVWTYTVAGAGSAAFTANASGTDANSGLTVSMPAISPPVTQVIAPAGLAIDSMTLLPGPNVRFTATLTATVVIRNTGGEPVVVTSLVRTVTDASILVSPSAPSVPTPFTIAPNGTQAISWTYLTAGSCGYSAASAAASGTGSVTGLPASASGTSSAVGVAGLPASVAANPASSRVVIRGNTAVVVTVLDGCGVPVRDAPVNAVLLADTGSAQVSPWSAATDSSGQATLVFQVGAFPGINAIRIDVPSGVNPSTTAMVEAIPPAKPTTYLSQNSFSPGRGERLKIRILEPTAVRLAVRVYNVAGELVRVVRTADVQPGLTVWEWDGKTASGGAAAGGLYLIQIQSGETVEIRRVIVQRP